MEEGIREEGAGVLASTWRYTTAFWQTSWEDDGDGGSDGGGKGVETDIGVAETDECDDAKFCGVSTVLTTYFRGL